MIIIFNKGTNLELISDLVCQYECALEHKIIKKNLKNFTLYGSTNTINLRMIFVAFIS